MADTSKDYGGNKATVAPTNQGTLAKLQGEKATEVELDFVTLVHQQWLMAGTLMTEADAANVGIGKELYDRFLKSEFITSALEERGITWPPPVGDLTVAEESWRTVGLQPLQLLVANVVLDLNDQRSIKKKLQDHNVSLAKYQSWLQDPKFSGYLKQRAENLLGTHQHEARLALMDRVSSGDVKAIQFYLEMTGEYVQQRNDGSVQVADIQSLLVKVVEIIAEEVDDPHTAARIADRFKTIMTARNVVGQMLDSDSGPVVPEIAKPRDMTPGLQKLMNAGGNT